MPPFPPIRGGVWLWKGSNSIINTSRQSILNLGQLAVDPKMGWDLRNAAAFALARMHTSQTLPYLARLLDDPDAYLRRSACGGMANFAKNAPITTTRPAGDEWTYFDGTKAGL